MFQGQHDQLAVADASGDVGGLQVLGGNEEELLGERCRGLGMAMCHQGRERLDLTLLLRKGPFLSFQTLPDGLCTLAVDV
jgi:hypothetical protein